MKMIEVSARITALSAIVFEMDRKAKLYRIRVYKKPDLCSPSVLESEHYASDFGSASRMYHELRKEG